MQREGSHSLHCTVGTCSRCIHAQRTLGICGDGGGRVSRADTTCDASLPNYHFMIMSAYMCDSQGGIRMHSSNTARHRSLHHLSHACIILPAWMD